MSSVFDRIEDLLPAHIEAPIYEHNRGPGEYARQSVYNRAPTTPGLYNGPFVISEFRSGERVVLERNPHWSGTPPGFARIIVKTIENTAALQANLLSGDIDVAPGDAPGLTLDQVLALRKQMPDRFAYVFRPALTYENITLNLDNPILADVRVRRALLLALDRNTLVDRMFERNAAGCCDFRQSAGPDAQRRGARRARSTGRARAPFWPRPDGRPGSDGICRNAAGERLSLEFRTTAGNRLRELQQQVMKDQWRAACIEAVVKNEPARTFFGETLKRRAFTAMAMFAWTSAVSFPPRQTLGADQIPNGENGWSGTNYMGWHDPAMDAAIATAETELDPAKQKDAWAAMQRIYAADVPVLPLFFRAEAHVLPKWLVGYRPTGHSDPASDWAETWRRQ